MECPICGFELKKEYAHCGAGFVEESKYLCEHCRQYTEVFDYGETEIYIGDFITGYRYNTPKEKIEIINKAIKILCEYYKNGSD